MLMLHSPHPLIFDAPIETGMKKRRYSDEEKRQLIANLDIEVAHRSRQLKAELEIKVETFGLHQLAQISRIPKQVRNMTIREFGEKYQGNLQSALRGYQKERLAAAGIDGSKDEADRSERKRKWVASHDVDPDVSAQKEQDPERSLKTARTQLHSPKKPTNGMTQRSQIPAPKTPNSRTLGRPITTPSPQKRPPFQQISVAFQRPPSPVKTQLVNNDVPPNSVFNPSLPPKTPSFPPRGNAAVRLPRKDESLLSMNGSPLANPYEFGLGWFKGIEAQMDEDAQAGQLLDQTTNFRSLKRSKSSIVIRRDPPVSADGIHSRTDSQLSFYTASSRTASSTHSRENSQLSPVPAPPETSLGTFRFPSSRPINGNDATPRPISHTRSYSALVAIPTKDGRVLEFDPLQTSPGSLDALEGISDSAKRHAKGEMGKLIQATVDKWKVR